MGVNKVVVNGPTKLDLTGDTVSASDLAEGKTAHNAAGTQVTGTLSFRSLYTSTSDPESSDGAVGDIWIVTA